MIVRSKPTISTIIKRENQLIVAAFKRRSIADVSVQSWSAVSDPPLSMSKVSFPGIANNRMDYNCSFN